MAIKLTKDYDVLTGTDNNDVFTAKVLGNSNTFQSGDEINGGKGTDTLNIVLGNESQFAISAETAGVEKVSVRSQSTNTDGNSGDNNVSNDATIDADIESDNVIDAQDMVGVKEFWNTDSRADLVIEDVRIGGIDGATKNAKGQIITENVTIGWKNADPASMGDKVDYEVYFSPESLRKSDGSSSLVLQWLDVDSASKGGNPLENTPFQGVILTTDLGEEITLASEGIAKAKTYEALLDALNTAGSAFGVTASLGKVFAVNDTETTTVEGQELVLTIVGDNIVSSKNKNEVGTTPGDSGHHTQSYITDVPGFITSKVVLDNVGRESESGDLVIGSMSTRSGVEKFKVEVLRDKDTRNDVDDIHGNWVGSMSSTNEKLQEVVITKNDGAYLYIGTGMDPTGNKLTVKRDEPDYVNTDGLTDVRVFDASKMTGDVKVGATLKNTDGADGKESAKYNLDSMSASTALYYDSSFKDSNENDQSDEGEFGFVDFNYTTGSGNDTVNLNITDHCDLTITTGKGNDKVRLNVGDVKVTGAQPIDNIGGKITINLGAGTNSLELDNEAKEDFSADTIVIDIAFTKNTITNFNTGHDQIDLAAGYSYLTNGTIYEDTNGDGAYTKLDDLLIGKITVNGGDLTGVTIV